MEKPDKRENILKAAEKLFCDLGYEGTSTRQIAKDSGANMAMINYYFGSKEGVFMEIMTEKIQHFNTQLKSIDQNQSSGMEKLLMVIEGYANRIMTHRSLHKMMHRELSFPHRPEMFSKIKEVMANNVSVIEHIIEEGIEKGQFRKVDTRMLIATVMGTISNVAVSPSKITSGSGLDIENKKDRKIITERMILHVKELVTLYLTPTNDTQKD